MMIKVNKTEEMSMKEELQRMKVRLKEESEALLKLIEELNRQAEGVISTTQKSNQKR